MQLTACTQRNLQTCSAHQHVYKAQKGAEVSLECSFYFRLFIQFFLRLFELRIMKYLLIKKNEPKWVRIRETSRSVVFP